MKLDIKKSGSWVEYIKLAYRVLTTQMGIKKELSKQEQTYNKVLRNLEPVKIF